jgi:Domain of unknown function (DUF4326)
LTTRVVNIKSKEHFDIYIGNRVRFHPYKYPQTKWGNPYAPLMKKYGRGKVVAMYREHILANPGLTSQLHELKDKVLGCWCKPEKCHGDVLVELVDKQNLVGL